MSGGIYLELKRKQLAKTIDKQRVKYMADLFPWRRRIYSLSSMMKIESRQPFKKHKWVGYGTYRHAI